MVDKIEYADINGKLEKTVTGKAKDFDVVEEIRVLQAQLEDFKLGQEKEYSDEIAAAILNYEEQILFLKGKS